MKELYEYEHLDSSVSVMENGELRIGLSDCAYSQLHHDVPVEESRKIYEALKQVFEAKELMS